MLLWKSTRLFVLAKKTPDFHCISHPGFLHADIAHLDESSTQGNLFLKDDLLLSFSDYEMVCQSIIKATTEIHQGTNRSAPQPPSLVSACDGRAFLMFILQMMRWYNQSSMILSVQSFFAAILLGTKGCLVLDEKV